MISSVESPSRFFIQKAGPQSKELDRLIEFMTDFYSNEDNRLQYAASKVWLWEKYLNSETGFLLFLKIQLYDVGALVAVFILDDNCWYRATVVSIVELNEDNIDDSILSVDILDFGDRLMIKQCYIANLNHEFLNLRFQAVECTLASIKPAE